MDAYYRFQVHLTDQDYYDFNAFFMIRSPYGKKQVKMMRITLIAIIALFVLIALVVGGFSVSAFAGIIPLLLILLLAQIFLTKYLKISVKGQLANLKKSGKPGYSPEAVLEFFEDRIVETTPNSRTEQGYFAIERVSIVDHKVIYFHENTVRAYLLPLSAFDSQEQYNRFLGFIQTKCAHVTEYEK